MSSKLDEATAMPRSGTLAACMVAALTVVASASEAVELFDGALGTAPPAQGWIYLTDPLFGASATQTVTASSTVLDTTPIRTEKAGYFSRVVRPPLPPLSHPSMPALNRFDGYRVGFEVRLTTEQHASADRAGFSVIVLSSDSWGVEIGFWTDEIWIQNDNPLFSHGEGVAFDTTAGLTRYDLCVLGDDYRLSVGDGPILSGRLRNYSAFGSPYSDHRDFLFLGDDTSSAAATTEVAWVEAGPLNGSLALGNALRLTHDTTTIRIDLPTTPGATAYRLYRDRSKRTLGVTLFDAVPTPPLSDRISLGEADAYYFIATVTDDCGNEYERKPR